MRLVAASIIFSLLTFPVDAGAGCTSNPTPTQSCTRMLYLQSSKSYAFLHHQPNVTLAQARAQCQSYGARLFPTCTRQSVNELAARLLECDKRNDKATGTYWSGAFVSITDRNQRARRNLPFHTLQSKCPFSNKRVSKLVLTYHHHQGNCTVHIETAKSTDMSNGFVCEKGVCLYAVLEELGIRIDTGSMHTTDRHAYVGATVTGACKSGGTKILLKCGWDGNWTGQLSHCLNKAHLSPPTRKFLANEANDVTQGQDVSTTTSEEPEESVAVMVIVGVVAFLVVALICLILVSCCRSDRRRRRRSHPPITQNSNEQITEIKTNQLFAPTTAPSFDTAFSTFNTSVPATKLPADSSMITAASGLTCKPKDQNPAKVASGTECVTADWDEAPKPAPKSPTPSQKVSSSKKKIKTAPLDLTPSQKVSSSKKKSKTASLDITPSTKSSKTSKSPKSRSAKK